VRPAVGCAIATSTPAANLLHGACLHKELLRGQAEVWMQLVASLGCSCNMCNYCVHPLANKELTRHTQTPCMLWTHRQHCCEEHSSYSQA
jgi:hypothetical protein